EAVNYHYHVVTTDDEMARNVKKGESARLFINKHPRLKWFLGLNPLSVAIYKQISKRPKWLDGLMRVHQSDSFFKPLATYVLNEYHYLKGVLA
ncbi:hypothetical protein EBR96_10775, partial [bacterium]|nr:hypothetical protein [bacterium]